MGIQNTNIQYREKSSEITGVQKKNPSHWEKGISGNPKGRPKGTGKPINILKEILRNIANASSENEKKIYQEQFADFFQKAKDGNTGYAIEILNYV